MNKIILGVFLFISFLGSAQKSEYIYVIKFLKCCDEPTHHDPNWKLKSSNDDIYLPDNNQVIVPDSGQYFLISSIYDNQPVPILIKNINQTDTIYLTCLYIENSEIVTNKRYNQSAQKWLKDRKGRTLEFDDILHYQKIIVALTETDRLMREIDCVATSW